MGQKTSAMWGLEKFHVKHGWKSICVEDHCRLKNCGFSAGDQNLCSALCPDGLIIANLDGMAFEGIIALARTNFLAMTDIVAPKSMMTVTGTPLTNT